jgi:hypothetical protein
MLEGEKMAVLCREFDISRKTGYMIFQRYIRTAGWKDWPIVVGVQKRN